MPGMSERNPRRLQILLGVRNKASIGLPGLLYRMTCEMGK